MKKANISRRNFLEKTAILGAAGVIGVSTLNSCKAKKTHDELGLPPIIDKAPDGKKLRAGLVGCGNRGTGAVLNFMDAGNNLEIVALADVFEDKVQQCSDKLKQYKIGVPAENLFHGLDAYKQLLDVDLDIVLLATPPKFRPEHLKACVSANKHVFMEKPACVDPVGARSIIATSKKAAALGLTIITGTQRRHQRDYIETYKQIANGAIGKITSARAYWLQSHVWFRSREESWSDMEYMLRNWNNFCWLCGDHILDTHVHNIDVINWFVGKHPQNAIGFGGRARRLTGDQYDFFSIDYNYGRGLFSHSMSRQVDNCANNMGEFIMGTEGFTNCKNTIYNPDGTIKWSYEYPKDKNGKSSNTVKVSPYVQEHIHLITAIRTNTPVQEAEQTAISTLSAIMGRTAAYTGEKVTWEDMMTSNEILGPKEIVLRDYEETFEVPVPGTQHKL